MPSLPPDVERAILDALEQMFRMERMLMKFDRNRIRASLDSLKKALAAGEDLLEALDAIPHTELDMRMARLRIKTATGLEPPSLLSDPDKTPVEALQARKSPAGVMLPVRGETMPGLGSKTPRPVDPKK